MTVSSQITNPISVGGRILDVSMKVYSITIVATLAGALGRLLQRCDHELDDQH